MPAQLFFLLVGSLGVLAAFLHLGLGSTYIPISTLCEILFTQGGDEVQHNIVWALRLPRTLLAVLAGGSLALSGLLMQTLFRNPIAGPYILGISGGASLGVALLVLSTGSFVGAWLGAGGLVLAASLGAAGTLVLILLVAWRVQDLSMLLVLGLMVGSISSALVSILQYFSQEEALQRYVIWAMGNLGGVTWSGLRILWPVCVLGWVGALFLVKPLNAWLLGDAYAESMGVPTQRIRWIVLVIAALLAGSITAFCGPIAFLGLAVPHIARWLLQTERQQLLMPASLLLGATLLLYCDLLARGPFTAQTLPLNALTALIGAPLVIVVVLRYR